MKLIENMSKEQLKEVIRIKNEEIKRLKEEITIFIELVESIKGEK